jgi:hypothetical protein
MQGEMRNTKFCPRNLKGRDHLHHRGGDRRTIINRSLARKAGVEIVLKFRF